MPGQSYLLGASQILLGILVTIAAIYDIRCRRVPNWLVLAGVLVGFAWLIRDFMHLRPHAAMIAVAWLSFIFMTQHGLTVY